MIWVNKSYNFPKIAKTKQWHNHTLCIFHGIYCRYKGGPHRSRAVVLYMYYVVIYVLCILGKETCSRLPGPQASRFLCIRIMSIKHFMLTHWGRVTHICVIKLTIIGSDNLNNYLNQCWNIVNKALRNKLQWNFNRNSNIFIQENAFESVVCEKAAILSRPQCVNTLMPGQNGPLCIQHSQRH